MSKKVWLNTLSALGLMLGVTMAQACTLDAWLGAAAAGGDQVAGGPNEPVTIPRFSGSCAMQVTNGFVQDPSPADENRMITRFYVLPDGGGTAELYKTFASDDGSGNPVYTVSYDNGSITVTDNVGGGSVGPIALNGGSWNSVEIDWQANGTFSVWVNRDSTAQAANGSANSGNGTISSALLGSDNPTGSVSFLYDDYEARRTTAVGQLLDGDANGDGNVNIFDAIGVVNEILGNAFNGGTPDCNRDGVVNIFDAICIVNVILGN